MWSFYKYRLPKNPELWVNDRNLFLFFESWVMIFYTLKLSKSFMYVGTVLFPFHFKVGIYNPSNKQIHIHAVDLDFFALKVFSQILFSELQLAWNHQRHATVLRWVNKEKNTLWCVAFLIPIIKFVCFRVFQLQGL